MKKEKGTVIATINIILELDAKKISETVGELLIKGIRVRTGKKG